MNALQTEIEARLSGVEPEVEVLLAEIVSGSTLRLFIDHPGGVTLGLCERVSGHLTDYRERYSLEVSSPGQDRPLTRPQHYTRFLGRRARLRLRGDQPQPAAGSAASARTTAEPPEGRTQPAATPTASAPRPQVVVGELVGASESEVTIAAPDGVVAIPYEQIVRSNLVPGD